MNRPVPDLHPGNDPALVDRIRSEIEAAGPITFARFMELALYEPGLGYYRSAEARPGRGGDFLSAPETHPIFGRAIARQLEEMWERLDRPSPFVVREYGAGSGALASSALDGLRRDGSGLSDAIRWDPVEVEQARLDAFAVRLDAAGHRGALESAGEPFAGVILANEFLDALPVHRVTVRDGRLLELLVTWREDRFGHEAGSPTTPALADRLAAEEVELEEGQVAEICLAVDRWMAEAAGALAQGFALIVDYGHRAAELYGPDRRAGTLRAYVRHAAHDDPFRNVGRQDLTAHVDLTAVEQAARAQGFDLLGVTSQAEFIAGVGGDELLEAARREAASYQDYLALRFGVARLLDPRATGGFRVVILGRGVALGPPLAGLSFRLADRG